MSEKSTTYTVLHLRFKLRVPPDVFLAHSREAAAIIASVEGLIWKIWVLQQEESEIGGIYLFANRKTAEAYLNHPVTQAVRRDRNRSRLPTFGWIDPSTPSSCFIWIERKRVHSERCGRICESHLFAFGDSNNRYAGFIGNLNRHGEFDNRLCRNHHALLRIDFISSRSN